MIMITYNFVDELTQVKWSIDWFDTLADRRIELNDLNHVETTYDR